MEIGRKRAKSPAKEKGRREGRTMGEGGRGGRSVLEADWRDKGREEGKERTGGKIKRKCKSGERRAGK